MKAIISSRSGRAPLRKTQTQTSKSHWLCAVRGSAARRGSHDHRPGGPGRRGSLRQCEEPRDCCPQNAADELDPELIAMCIDEGDHFVTERSSSAAKNADADFKISLALRSS